jgi:hypothetical protein
MASTQPDGTVGTVRLVRPLLAPVEHPKTREIAHEFEQ